MGSLVQIQETPTWKKFLSYVGPGLLVSVAYLDPGNLETDLQAGADHKYELLWIVLLGLAFALIIQSRSANLGVATGRHLSEHCKDEYPKPVTYCLWILAEVSVIAADIPQVIGIAFALKLLLNIPLWSGVMLAGLNTLLLLGLQKYGIRKLELAIAVLLMIVGGCFFSVMVHAQPNVKDMAMGMFIPKLSNGSATRDSIALLGALIMPHNLFLHSALVTSRKIHRSNDQIRVIKIVFLMSPNKTNKHKTSFLPLTASSVSIQNATKYFLLESGMALFIAFLVNVAVVSVSGSICSNPYASADEKAHCNEITLDSAAFLLKDSLGKWSSKLYAVSLLASGQSSSVTGTFAGQYIMQGFLDLKMKLWLRNLLTRCIAIAPSLMVCVIGGSSGAGKLIIIASMILSFELPFALVPLLRFTSSGSKMGQHKNSKMVTVITWLLGFCSIGVNIYFLSRSLFGWLTSKKMPRAVSIFSTVMICPVMVLYVAMLAYLTLKPEATSKSVQSSEASSTGTVEMELEQGADFKTPM
ncbi:PREDICTED: metal transporter Nramp1-like isoform X1 [Ipomoea nil]|uniref:metal transporter Nramp1-like isoform X1 n=1 Tax=Ipomoea nil TaxID=35883 RepID=UPI00090194BF|nr:PREDICTED: metal transporter Nramp1-like isoform X1 [Ipomoea nil]